MQAKRMGITQFEPLIHRPELTELESWCVDTLRTWSQRGRPMPAPALSEWLGLSGRDTRSLINHLIDRETHGLPIYPAPGTGGGYFMAEGGSAVFQELTGRAVATQLQRARTSAIKARDLGATGQELAEGVVQLTLDLGPEVQNRVRRTLGPARGQATQADVRRVLTRYAKDPARFAAEIAELRRQFGGLFVRDEDVARVLRRHNEELIARTVADMRGAA